MTNPAANHVHEIKNRPFEVVPITAFEDNYVWLIHHHGRAAVVDPGDAEPVLAYLQQHQLTLDAILITHYHADHIDGVAALLHNFPEASTYTPAKKHFDFTHHQVVEGNAISLPSIGITLQVMETPGHTAEHVAYYGANCLFCGDTLFGCGCGRLFDGTCEQLYTSLQRLSELPGETLVYCAHEYTQQNTRFARLLDTDNPALVQREANADILRERNQPTLPSTIALEISTNPFLRCTDHNIQLAVSQLSNKSLTDAQAVFCAMRELKNHY